ncbi:MAG: hypothetical protein AAFX85_10130 [Pseudomonadota bacterium]
MPTRGLVKGVKKRAKKRLVVGPNGFASVTPQSIVHSAEEQIRSLSSISSVRKSKRRAVGTAS